MGSKYESWLLPLRVSPPCPGRGRNSGIGGGFQKVRGTKSRGQGVGRAGVEGEGSQVFFSAEARTAVRRPRKEIAILFQHRDSGQRLSGSGMGPAICFSTGAADSSWRRPGAPDFVSAPGQRTAPRGTQEPLCLDGWSEGGQRCPALLETCPSWNGFFHELFSR